MKIILLGNKIREQIKVWQPKESTGKGNIGVTMSPITLNRVWVGLT